MKILLFFLLLLPFATNAQITGKVVGIADGDTFTLLNDSNRQIKIRLYGIDCPEKGQDYGQVCKAYLSELIFSKNVKVLDKGLDRYGRTLGIVYIGDMNVNENMITEGMAWHFKKYDNNEAWAQLEIMARTNKKGLWSQANPIAPWDYRYNARNKK